jgi:hypothetical protein
MSSDWVLDVSLMTCAVTVYQEYSVPIVEIDVVFIITREEPVKA